MNGEVAISEMVVKKSVKIKAAVGKVWDVLTNPQITKKYMFGCEVLSDWKIGSSVIWKGAADGKVYVKGKVISIKPNRILQYTVFDPNTAMKDVPSNYLTVTYELTRENGHTTLSIMQGDFSKVAEGEKRFRDTVTGWDSVLPKLTELAEK